MTDIIFVKTRHHYDSYTDFFRLAELNEFPIIYVDELDISHPGVYITTPLNGEWEPHIDNQRHKTFQAYLIQWNLERPTGSAGTGGEYMRRQWWLMHNRYFDEVWVSDAELARESSLRFVVLGSDEQLGEPGEEKKFDFCHMSYETGRRQTIYKSFPVSSIAPNCWPPERDIVLKQSRFALNVHQDRHPYQEPLRLALFAAYGLPIISESIYDMTPWIEESIITTGYDSLISRIKQALTEDYAPYLEMAMRARDRMCKDFQFGKVVREAVRQSVDNWR